MKIDIFAHILPPKYLEALNKKTKLIEVRTTQNKACVDLEMRMKLMDRFPDVLQVLTIAIFSTETQLSPKDSLELAKIANNELAKS